ncbi:uncharacterized protein PGTG_20953 [Puccinia graminis f. sp. tritici CRL 75-36-700-3]|uniref:No apical meristem-associated C-terminal domain-containing protein n=1 Tax=Puccinia graminis f. sp. tritici (strain CRL 75-36-700-3 / race SCCL) TaxID=418459 RepID=H6QQ07_PUCGT|nr:uncharacterized protein PGTG_20953 [Puccinia graminis f. sp. tritici CRL 75-36-700-3]EHS64490.1 hypothetical protein PGTG_20953 [Puccinia graminis f. sp. tritici CRL 75-36-700-3]
MADPDSDRDAIVGRGQKATTFWEQIHENYIDLVKEYNTDKKNSAGFKELPLRLVGGVECRWGLILKALNKLSGCYSTVERRLQSGKTRADILTEAKELYKTTVGSTFNLDHCWGILKDAPKWQANQQENAGRSKKAKEPGTSQTPTNLPSSTPRTSSPAVIDLDEDESDLSRSVLGSVRLEGNKAAKRKRAEESSIEKMVALQKDLVQISRDRLSSMKSATQSTLDDAIMSKDLTNLDDETRAYYQKKKRAIIARDLQEEKEKEEREKKEKEEKEKKEKEKKERKEREEKERKEKEEKERHERERAEEDEDKEEETEEEQEDEDDVEEEITEEEEDVTGEEEVEA